MKPFSLGNETTLKHRALTGPHPFVRGRHSHERFFSLRDVGRRIRPGCQRGNAGCCCGAVRPHPQKKARCDKSGPRCFSPRTQTKMKRGIAVLLSVSALVAVAYFTASKWAIRHETLMFYEPARANGPVK